MNEGMLEGGGGGGVSSRGGGLITGSGSVGISTKGGMGSCSGVMLISMSSVGGWMVPIDWRGEIVEFSSRLTAASLGDCISPDVASGTIGLGCSKGVLATISTFGSSVVETEVGMTGCSGGVVLRTFGGLPGGLFMGGLVVLMVGALRVVFGFFSASFAFSLASYSSFDGMFSFTRWTRETS